MPNLGQKNDERKIMRIFKETPRYNNVFKKIKTELLF